LIAVLTVYSPPLPKSKEAGLCLTELKTLAVTVAEGTSANILSTNYLDQDSELRLGVTRQML
jgi:hypothetical protein